MSNRLLAASIAFVSISTIAVWAILMQAELNVGSWSSPGIHAPAEISALASSILGAFLAAYCIRLGTRRKWHHVAAVGFVSAVMAAIFLIFTVFCIVM